MKKFNVTLAALLVMGFTGITYAEMGKCNGMQKSNMKNKSGMMMGKDFSTQRDMMHDHINKAEACIDRAKTTQDLSNCRMGMMQRNQSMMQNGKGMMQNNKGMMKNSPGKCSGNQGMMKNSNKQNQIYKIKQCVNAATTLQEIENCKVGMMQNNKGMMQGNKGMMKNMMKNSQGKCSGN
ncbi:MAG: hypothetical protein PHS85_10380 [Sulfurovum sp.]|nr:hypothetical protein [Sulfurovum sp.]